MTPTIQDPSGRGAQRLEWARGALGDPYAQLERASMDAGFRSYWRSLGDGPGRIVMDSPPGLEDVRPWLAMRELLLGGDVRVPEVLAIDTELGFLLLEDLGGPTLAHVISEDNADTWFGFSDLTLLRTVHGRLQEGVPFRAVLRDLQSTRTGQLAFDFRLDAHQARILELPSARRMAQSRDTDGQQAQKAQMDAWLQEHSSGATRESPPGPRAMTKAEEHFLMGSLLDDGTPEHLDEAAKAYRMALDEDPDLVAALINLANIRYSKDELAEAQALYERAIGLDPTYFEAYFNLGNIHHDHGRYLDAEACYREAMGLNPSYADTHFYLAVTLEKMGRSADARTHWRAYRDLAPEGEWVELAREFSE